METLLTTADHVAGDLAEFFYSLAVELTLLPSPEIRPTGFLSVHEALTGDRNIKQSMSFTKDALHSWAAHLDNGAHRTSVHTVPQMNSN